MRKEVKLLRYKVNNYLQKASTYLVNQFVSNDILTVVIGYNKNWKQDINLGKKNNQNFKEAWKEDVSFDLVEVCSAPSATKVTVNFS